jgi:hypothetical protein
MRRTNDRIGPAALLGTCALCATISLARADEIALSLVHGGQRIDVPAGAVVSIEALPYSLYRNIETGEITKGGRPYVEICFNAAIGARLCELTQRIVGESLELWVSCQAIVKPVVREPLCSDACLKLSAFNLPEAEQLVSKLNAQPKLACP